MDGGRRERGRTWLRSLRLDFRGSGGARRTSAPHNLVPKPTPANLRRFAETPVARRAINVIKDRIVGDAMAHPAAAGAVAGADSGWGAADPEC